MEETSRRSILGRHLSCYQERIAVLSDSIERNYSSRYTSSLIVFRKFIRMKTGEVLYEKVYMSPRPPPKISKKHEWKRELVRKLLDNQKGKLLDNQKEKLLDKQKVPNQPNQLPNPIRERSGRPDDMQDGRNTYRSQEINVNSFSEELSSSERTGRLVETDVIQTSSSEDRKSLNVEQTHERTVRPVATLNTADTKDSSRVRSSHESDMFNVEDEVLRKKNGKIRC